MSSFYLNAETETISFSKKNSDYRCFMIDEGYVSAYSVYYKFTKGAKKAATLRGLI